MDNSQYVLNKTYTRISVRSGPFLAIDLEYFKVFVVPSGHYHYAASAQTFGASLWFRRFGGRSFQNLFSFVVEQM